jgi:hypothetical protein
VRVTALKKEKNNRKRKMKKGRKRIKRAEKMIRKKRDDV